MAKTELKLPTSVSKPFALPSDHSIVARAQGKFSIDISEQFRTLQLPEIAGICNFRKRSKGSYMQYLCGRDTFFRKIAEAFQKGSIPFTRYPLHNLALTANQGARIPILTTLSYNNATNFHPFPSLSGASRSIPLGALFKTI